MALKGEPKSTLYVGIDGGGSKCRAIVYSTTHGVLGDGLSGPANPFQDFELAIKSITEASMQAAIKAGFNYSDLGDMTAGIALAGVNIPSVFNAMQIWKSPFKQHLVLTDLHAACLGAHSGGDGAVIIAGTGSCGYASVNGKSLTIGAHGFPHGDKGSGAWIGLQAVEHCLLAMDQLGQDSILRQKIAADNPLDLVSKVSGQPPRFYARLAPLVFEAAEEGDVIAQNILQEAGDYLSQVGEKLLSLNPPKLTLIGGITARILPYLTSKVRNKITDAEHPPEIGAILYAQNKINADTQNLKTNDHSASG